MGTDIHEYMEKRQPNGTWEQVPAPNLWRNYDVFSILADVRNGYGFGGCKTGEGLIPISEPKGLPNDLSVGLLEQIEDDWGFHSHSWLTLRELQEYDYEQETTKYGVIGETSYVEWKQQGGGFPKDGWSGGISGWAHETVTPEEMDRIITGERVREIKDPQNSCLYPEIATKYAPTEISYSVIVSWPIKYKDVAKPILETLIPAMEVLADGDPDSVRFVFWFDS